MKIYKKVEGELIIMNDGTFLVGKTKLQDYDSVNITITTLKRIIADSKLGII